MLTLFVEGELLPQLLCHVQPLTSNIKDNTDLLSTLRVVWVEYHCLGSLRQNCLVVQVQSAVDARGWKAGAVKFIPEESGTDIGCCSSVWLLVLGLALA